MNQDWNYFNYFTEIEEHGRRVRGSGLCLLAPRDWARISAWKDSGVPREAVLRGIEAAFENWRARKHKTQMVNSLAFCAQAVLAEAERMQSGAPQRRPAPPPFEVDDLRRFLAANAEQVRGAGYAAIADALERLAAEAETHYPALEELERRLTVLEEKLLATARAAQSEDDLLSARRQLESQIRPYRGKMTADQLAMIERQFLDRLVFESAGLPRLSLFYLR